MTGATTFQSLTASMFLSYLYEVFVVVFFFYQGNHNLRWPQLRGCCSLQHRAAGGCSISLKATRGCAVPALSVATSPGRGGPCVCLEAAVLGGAGSWAACSPWCSLMLASCLLFGY